MFKKDILRAELHIWCELTFSCTQSGDLGLKLIDIVKMLHVINITGRRFFFSRSTAPLHWRGVTQFTERSLITSEERCVWSLREKLTVQLIWAVQTLMMSLDWEYVACTATDVCQQPSTLNILGYILWSREVSFIQTNRDLLSSHPVDLQQTVLWWQSEYLMCVRAHGCMRVWVCVSRS